LLPFLLLKKKNNLSVYTVGRKADHKKKKKKKSDWLNTKKNQPIKNRPGFLAFGVWPNSTKTRP
jgi:hypothetical protein